MKNALILLLFVTPLIAQPKKHVATEAEKCWKSVQAISMLDLDTEAKNVESVTSLTSHLNTCADTLKADKFKASVARNLENLILTLRDKDNLQELSTATAKQYSSALLAKADAENKEQQSEAMLKAAINAYIELSADYQKHLASDSRVSQVTIAPVQKNRGYWASVLQGMADGAKAEASKPTIHCTSTAAFNTIDTDCR